MEKSETAVYAGVVGIAGRPRLLGALLLLAGAAVFGGALVAPWIHRALVAVGRSYGGLAALRDLPFERVAGRCAQAILLLGLVPAFRWGGLCRWADLGLSPGRTGGQDLVAGFLAGVAMILGVGLAGWGLGVYQAGSLARLPGVVLFLPAALAVACLEEILFRGGVYRSLRVMGGVWPAALASSLVFSAVHFAAPVPTVGVAHAHWDSGLRLIPDTFRMVHASHHYFPFMVTLLLMGIALCLLAERRGSLYPVIGLHAGWIWALRGMAKAFERDPGRWPTIFGAGDQLAKGYAAAAAMVLLVLGLALWPLPAAAGKDP